MALDRSPDLFFVIGYVKHNDTFETKIEAQQCSIAIDIGLILLDKKIFKVLTMHI